MSKYIAGPSRLSLTGHKDPIEPGVAFDHDFTETGPEGLHGPAREAAMLLAGAITRADDHVAADSPVADDRPNDSALDAAHKE